MNSTNYCMSVYHTSNSVYRCAYMSHEWLYHFDRIARLWNAIIIQPYLAISLSFQHVQTRANMFPAYARCPNSLPFRFRHQLVIWCNDVDIVNLYIYIFFYIFLYVAMVVYTLHGACWLQALHPSRTVPWVRAAWNISYLGAMGRSEGKVWPDRTGDRTVPQNRSRWSK